MSSPEMPESNGDNTIIKSRVHKLILMKKAVPCTRVPFERREKRFLRKPHVQFTFYQSLSVISAFYFVIRDLS